MIARTPLAWQNLTHDRRRLAVAASGVGFAVLLIFMELGFLNALLESTVQVLRRLNGELVIQSAAKYALPARERFDVRRVHQAEGQPGVAGVYPVYVEMLGAVLREGSARGWPIRVLAFDERHPAFDLEALDTYADALRRPAAALVDEASRGKYGVPDRSGRLAEYAAELAGRRLELVGTFRLGVDFANDGNLLMTARNFAAFFPRRAQGQDPLSIVDLAVVKIDAEANAADVLRTLRAALPADVQVLTKDELIDREMAFWRRSAPVGYIFMVGVAMGFLVGVIICYQIIYADIADHLREFATLKAMGYTSAYFLGLVLRQSFYLALLGFAPGALVSYACYAALSRVTGLTMILTPGVAVSVLLITVGMCLVSGVLALRKLLSLDPAELF